MNTLPITLVGGPHCGTDLEIPPKQVGILHKGVPYRRSARRDSGDRQVFLMRHTRTLKGLKACDLG